MRLKDLREDADLRQKDIAEYLHIKQNTYLQYENNQRQLPIDVLIKLSKFYKVSTDYILELTDKKWLHKRQRVPKTDAERKWTDPQKSDQKSNIEDRFITQ